MLPSWMAAISSTTSLSTSATCERSFDRVGWSSSTTASGPRSPPQCATSNSTPDGTRSHSKPRRASGLTGSPTLASSLPSKASRRSETTYGLEARLGQCSGVTPEGRSGLLLCVPVFETRTDRLHCGLPEPAFVLRGPLVEAAERAVAEGFPPRPGVSVLWPFDWWLALCWDHNAGKPRPGEVLRPRRMVVVGIDFRRDLVRSSFPKLMPDHHLARPASCPRLARLGVSAMTVHDEDPREALAEQRIDDVREDCDQRGLQERGAARVRLELHPVEVADPHRDVRTLTPKPNPRLRQ